LACFGHALVRQVRGLLLHLDLVILRVPVALRLEVGQLVLELLDLVAQGGDGRLVAGVADIALDALDAHPALLDLLVGRVPLALHLHQVAGELVGQLVTRALLPRRPGDDQRRARLVDQDRVDLVHDAVAALLLHLLGRGQLHVVAQVVEAELGVRPVHRVAGVGAGLEAGRRLVVEEAGRHLGQVRQLAAHRPAHPLDQLGELGRQPLRAHVFGLILEHVRRVDRPHRHSQPVVEGKHPVAVALHEVIVDGDHVALQALDDRHVAGQGGDDGLAFTGLHLGDAAFAQHHAADELHIERPGAERRPTLRVETAHRLVQGEGDLDLHPGRRRLAAGQRLRLELGDLILNAGVDLARILGQLRCVELVLRVEDVADADRPVHHLTGDGHHLGQQGAHALAVADALLELGRPAAQLGVGQVADLAFPFVDLLDSSHVRLDQALVARAEHLGKGLADGINHG